MKAIIIKKVVARREEKFMEWYEIMIIILVVCSFVAVGFGSAFYGIMEHKRLIERAKKIDPTVKTRAEAEYVLKKDIAQSMGRTDDNK